MQKTLSLLSLAALLITLAGCEITATPKKENRIGKLTDGDQTVLTNINDNMNDLISARDSAGFDFMAVPISEKASKISTVMKTHCTGVGHIPAEDTMGKLNDATISGTDCPMYWFRRRGITVNGNNKILRIIDKYEVLDNESSRKLNYGATSGLIRRFEDGVINATFDGMKTRITGEIVFNDFQITDIGKVNVNIRTDQTITGDDGTGNIVITISTIKGQHVGWASWKILRNVMQAPMYTVDNVQIDEKDFNRLFSSFGLGKIIATSMRMK